MIKRDFDSTDPKLFQTAEHDGLVTAYAITSVMDSMVYYAKQKSDSWKDPTMKAEHNRIIERQSALTNLYFERFRDRCFCVTYTGCLPYNEGDINHHDIDDALVEKFGDAVGVDSESSMFFAYSTESMQDAIIEFLNEKFPTLYVEVEVEDDMDDPSTEHYRTPHLKNGWGGAKEWLDERGITIDYEPPKPLPKTGSELEQLLDEARVILAKTGLPKDEATRLL